MRAFTRFFETKPDSADVFTHSMQCHNFNGFGQRYAEAVASCRWYHTVVPNLPHTMVKIDPTLGALGGQAHLCDLLIMIPRPSAASLLHEVGHVVDFHLGNREAYMRDARRAESPWTTPARLAAEARATRFAGRVLALSRLEAADLAASFTTYLLAWRRSKALTALRALNRSVAHETEFAFSVVDLPQDEVLESNEFLGLAGTGLVYGDSGGYFAGFKKAVREELTAHLGVFFAESYVSTLEDFMVYGSITR